MPKAPGLPGKCFSAPPGAAPLKPTSVETICYKRRKFFRSPRSGPIEAAAASGYAMAGSGDKLRLVHRLLSVLAQQFDKFRQAPLFILSEMIVDMPAQVILPKIVIIFGPVANDGIEGVQTKIASFAKLPAKGRIVVPVAE